jgi:CheY-like chemotaxis protein
LSAIDSTRLPKIAFLDDDPMFLESIARFQKTLGRPVLITSDPEHVLRLVSDRQIDAVVSDLRMPMTNGVELLVRVRELDSHMPLVLLTAFEPTASEVSRLREIDATIHYKADAPSFLDALSSNRHIPRPSSRPTPSYGPRASQASAALHTVFLSYGGPDEAIAKAVYDALTARGAEVFFFPESAVPGQRLHRTMSEGIRHYDRVVLLCSSQSLGRPGVLNEIEQVLTKEAAVGGAELLIPITLDDFVFSTWSPPRADLASQVRTRVIADFRNRQPYTSAFDEAIGRVIAAITRRQ